MSDPVLHEEIRPGVFWFHPSDGGEMYILRAGETLVLVDTGLPRHKEVLAEAVVAAGLDPHTIELGFITHCHCDHVGGMGWWREQFDFPVLAHQMAVAPVTRGDPVVTGAHMPYAGFDEPFIPCPVDRTMGEGDVIVCGDLSIAVRHAPGHTVGSVHLEIDGLVFVGDNLFENGGIGWMDVHWGSNPEDYVATLSRLEAEHLGDLVLPGHGRPFILEAEVVDKARQAAAFYIPPEHGLGMPRATSATPPAW